MAVVIAGQPEEIAGIHTVSYLEDPRLRLRKLEDYHPRPPTWIRQIILHTTKGLPARPGDPPQRILTGIGTPVHAGERVVHYWSQDGRQAGAHLVVDHDGSVACTCDLGTEAAYHAGIVNATSIGIEIYQGADAELYLGQLQAAVHLVDWLTRRFGIQRQIPDRYQGGPIHRLELGGADCVGVFGHRDVTANRGPGDPGTAICDVLKGAGYEPFDFGRHDDLATWKSRQRDLGVHDDGIPGPDTVAALKVKSMWGLWIERPSDLGPDPAA